jgi:hypothetical protein
MASDERRKGFLPNRKVEVQHKLASPRKVFINAEAGWWTHFPRFFFPAYNVEFQRFES